MSKRPRRMPICCVLERFAHPTSGSPSALHELGKVDVLSPRHQTGALQRGPAAARGPEQPPRTGARTPMSPAGPASAPSRRTGAGRPARTRRERGATTWVPFGPGSGRTSMASKSVVQAVGLENVSVFDEHFARDTSTETVPGVVQEPVGGKETVVACSPLTWRRAVRAALPSLMWAMSTALVPVTPVFQDARPIGAGGTVIWLESPRRVPFGGVRRALGAGCR